MIIEVQKPGLFTSIQDGGRKGYQHLGIPKAGPMDRGAARRANWLVGNPIDGPVLEVTLMGPTLRCLAPGSIAVTGASLSPRIVDQVLPMNQTHFVQAGEIISFGKPQHGCRAYIAIAGDWSVPSWLNSFSASTTEIDRLTPASVLSKGMIVETLRDNPIATFRELIWDEVVIDTLRVVKGPEFGLFEEVLLAKFLNSRHTVSREANRMGYRIETKVRLSYDETMISSAVLPGAVQITRGGDPILLMADAQTSGGYPRVLMVIDADLDKAGQYKPGDDIRFSLIDLEEADIANRQHASEDRLLFI